MIILLSFFYPLFINLFIASKSLLFASSNSNHGSLYSKPISLEFKCLNYPSVSFCVDSSESIEGLQNSSEHITAWKSYINGSISTGMMLFPLFFSWSVLTSSKGGRFYARDNQRKAGHIVNMDQEIHIADLTLWDKAFVICCFDLSIFLLNQYKCSIFNTFDL